MNIYLVNVSDQSVIVHISAGKSLTSKLAYSDESHLEHTLTQILSSSSVSNDANETVANLVNLDAEIAQLLRERHARDDTQDLQTFLDGLVPGVKVDTWLSAMNTVLPSKRHLSANDIVVGRGVDSVRRCFETLVMSGLQMAAMYLAVSLQAEVAAIEMQKHLAAESKHHTIRFCLGLSQRAVAVTWHRIVTELAAVAEADDALVHDMFHALQRTSDDASVFSWLRRKSRLAATKVVHETSLTTSYYGRAGAEEPAAAYGSYAPTFGDPRHFVVDYMEALKEGQEVRFGAPPTWTELALSTLDPLGDVVYDPLLKLVALPAVFLTEPLLYATGVPMYYNYGIVGALLASQLATAVEHSGAIEVDAQGRPVPGRLRQRNVTLTCLRRLHERLGFAKNVSGSTQEQDDAMFALAQGVVLAHAGLAANLQASAPNRETYDSLWPEAQTTFFLRFCLWSCSASQQPSPLTPMERCLLPMHNMPAFADTFGCSKRSDFVMGDCRM
nr:uncharacterized protein LOC126523566 [Dermacentor andersoni]